MGANAPSPQFLALQKLGLSEDEIADVLATDKEIDKGAKLFELDPELQKGAKKARQADRTDTPKPRERKPNEDKATLVNALFTNRCNSPGCSVYTVTTTTVNSTNTSWLAK